MRRFVALDYGSNTTLVLVVRECCDGSLVHEAEYFRTTRLGAGMDKSRRLQQPAIKGTLAASADFLKSVPRDLPVVGIAAATSAVRDAVNRSEFLEPCRKQLGNFPLVLSGAEEARTIFLGAVSDQRTPEKLVNIDIGGGSSEISAGTQDHCEYATSLQVGCVRFAERFGLHDRASEQAISSARRAIHEVLEPKTREVLMTVLSSESGFPVVLATGGTATTLAAFRQELTEYDRRRVHGYRYRRGDVDEACRQLATMSASARGQLPGIPPDRAPVFPAGLLILSEFLSLFQAADCVVSTRGLRYGLIRRVQREELTPTWKWPALEC